MRPAGRRSPNTALARIQKEDMSIKKTARISFYLGK